MYDLINLGDVTRHHRILIIRFVLLSLVISELFSSRRIFSNEQFAIISENMSDYTLVEKGRK